MMRDLLHWLAGLLCWSVLLLLGTWAVLTVL